MEVDLTIWWPLTLALLVTVFAMLYLWEVTKSYARRTKLDLAGVEGFSGSMGIDQRIDDACYDAFYAKVYDPLVQPTARAPMETNVCLEYFETLGRKKEELRVVDIGCATGLHVELFARQGVRSVIGFDRSTAMIAEAKSRFPEREWIVGDATVATMATADQFDLITMFYFTVYMIPERTQMLKNIFLWLAPGGYFVCHIVNKLKFDPVLEAASPFIGFSVQKYADERITSSEVTFDEFDYKGDFQLHGSRAIYEETFSFKDGKTRKHEQRVWMPNIDLMVKEVTDAGFKMMHHVDLTAIGYEYNYLFFFAK